MKSLLYKIAGLIIFLSITAVAVVATERGVAISASSILFQNGGEALFENCVAKVEGDTLYLDFTFSYSGDIISSIETLKLTPQIIGAESGAFEALPFVIINGKRQAPFYKRERAMMSHSEFLQNQPLSVHTLNRKIKPQSIAYSYSAPIGVDFNEEYLSVEQMLIFCGDSTVIGYSHIPIQLPALPIELPNWAEPSQVTYCAPELEEVKERSEKLTVRISYPINRYDVQPRYLSNEVELRRVDELFSPFTKDEHSYYSVDLIELHGYASPEGPERFNQQLSEKRAEGFKEYLVSRFGRSVGSNIEAKGLGEDWDGLIEIVEDSTFNYKESLLDLLKMSRSVAERKHRLQNFRGGLFYRDISKNIYPYLRRIELEVSYTVRPMSSREVEDVIEKRPQDLSHREMFELALQQLQLYNLEQSRSAYGIEFEMVLKFFPDDPVAYINAGGAALVRGDLALAWEHLSEVVDEPRAANNIGVYYWLTEQYELAEKYLKAAAKSAPSESEQNLSILEEYFRER